MLTFLSPSMLYSLHIHTWCELPWAGTDYHCNLELWQQSLHVSIISISSSSIVRPDFTKKNLKKIRILLTYPREASDCFLFFWSFSLQLLKGYVAYIWNDHRSSLCAVFRRILFFIFFCSFSVHWFIRHFQPKCFVFSQDKGRWLQLILGHWAVRFPITG